MVTKIVIDAGHGGKDGGASSNGLREKDVVLDIALRMEKLLSGYKDVLVKLTRNDDTFLELQDRTKIANDWEADCLISVHCNAFTSSSAKGFETYIYNGKVKPETIAFQNILHQEIMRQLGTSVTDRVKNRANFHMVRESKMKAVLTENLFLTNASDANLLKSSEFIDKIAEGHVNGLVKFFGLERSIRPPTDTVELYQVIAGTFNSVTNARSQVKKLEADGYSAYIIKK